MHIILYLDQGTTLSQFEKIGTLEREIAAYIRFAELGHKVTIITWSKGDDRKYIDAFPGITIKFNQTRLPNRVWMFFYLLRLRKTACPETITLSNQLFGSYIPAIALVFSRIPYVLRFGYLNSIQDLDNYGFWSVQHLRSRLNEFVSMTLATHIVTTTETIRSSLIQRKASLSKKITVIPNYVDESHFRISESDNALSYRKQSEKFSIVMTARLAPPKRHDLVIQAVSKLKNTHLTCIGEGPNQKSLSSLAKRLNVDVKFLGQIKNSQLSEIYHKSSVFILFSDYEGHPKSLIEAMACGIPVVGSDVIGISDVIDHEQTGLLVPLSVEELTLALQKLQESPEQRKLLAINGYNKAKLYSLDTYYSNLELVLKTASMNHAS